MSTMWYLQPAPVVFKVTGKDARRYLQNRLSNDLRSLVPGDSCAAGALTPQGRVEGLFTVYVEADELFYLVSDAGERQPLFAAVSRYIVADRVSIVDCSSEALVGHVAGELSVSLSNDVVCRTSPRNRLGVGGKDILILALHVATAREELTRALGEPLAEDEYHRRRFSAGFVQYPNEVNDSTILTEAGLRDLVSFQKGCYVGQEVIERSDAIGKLPRRVERIVLDGSVELAPQAQVFGKDANPIGKILSSIPDRSHNRTLVFALLKTAAYGAGDAVQCEGVAGKILSSEERCI
jgi:folate-binding protein YgfZ